MVKFKCIGVLREKEHSPERVSDDAAILHAVADRLGQNAHIEVSVFTSNRIQAIPVLPDLVFYMCEEDPALDLFFQWQERGVIFVNNVESVKNTFRQNMHELLSGFPCYPATVTVSTDQPCTAGFERVWVKRGDYHAIQRDDVVYVDTPLNVDQILEKFRKRGIMSALVQEHIDGDLIKFYGVRDHLSNRTEWFHWFYHKNQELKNHPLDKQLLQKVCEQGAGRLGLEIFGGDVIVTENGRIWLIDVNAWPSFALFRDKASEVISDYIVSKLSASQQKISNPEDPPGIGFDARQNGSRICVA